MFRPSLFLGNRPPMPRLDVYRRWARECGALADAASDLEGRQYYLQLALTWNDVARADEALVSQENSTAMAGKSIGCLRCSARSAESLSPIL